MPEAQPLVAPLGPTDAFSPWPTLISARMGVASDGSVWIYSKGSVIQVAAAGTIPHPMMAELGLAARQEEQLPAPEGGEGDPNERHGHRARRR